MPFAILSSVSSPYIDHVLHALSKDAIIHEFEHAFSYSVVVSILSVLNIIFGFNHESVLNDITLCVCFT